MLCTVKHLPRTAADTVYVQEYCRLQRTYSWIAMKAACWHGALTVRAKRLV